MEYGEDEASALLYKKLGKYFDSVQMYLKVIKAKVDLVQLKKELKIATRNNLTTDYRVDNTKYLSNCSLFDHYFKIVMKICKKNHDDVDIGKEEMIWFIILDTLFTFKNNKEFAKNSLYKKFFSSRIQHFSSILMRFVPFKKFLNHVIQFNKNIKYKELIYIINEIFNDCRYYTIIINNSNHTIKRTNTQLF